MFGGLNGPGVRMCVVRVQVGGRRLIADKVPKATHLKQQAVANRRVEIHVSFAHEFASGASNARRIRPEHKHGCVAGAPLSFRYWFLKLNDEGIQVEPVLFSSVKGVGSWIGVARAGIPVGGGIDVPAQDCCRERSLHHDQLFFGVRKCRHGDKPNGG